MFMLTRSLILLLPWQYSCIATHQRRSLVFEEAMKIINKFNFKLEEN